MTNYEKIKAMSVEEMAKLFGHNTICEYIQDNEKEFCEAMESCSRCIEKWLLQEAEE